MEHIEEQQTPKITVKEFHHWLEGVIDMQEDGWVPDSKQWSKILSKIYEIDDSAAQPARPPITYSNGPVYRNAPPVQQPIQQPAVSQQPLQHAPSTLATANPISQPVHLQGPISTGSGQIPVKTPDVGGSYDTPFV